MSDVAKPRFQCRVDRLPMDHPGDMTGLHRLFDDGTLDPASIVAILGKTEGNGCVNDFSRPYAVDSLLWLLADRLGVRPEIVADRVSIIMSGGTEGGLSPHFLVFSVAASSSPSGGSPSLAIGTAFTRDLRPEEIGRIEQVHATAAAVIDAMALADITSPADVHYVQVKCPLLTSGRIAEAHRRGEEVVTENTYASMGFSRGASALGVALALGEIGPDALTPSAIGHDLSLWSRRAGASAGIELTRNEVVVMGNSAGWDGDMSIAHSVMLDAIDVAAVRSALSLLDIPVDGQLAATEADRICAVLAKAEPSRSGVIRGSRHIMWDDSDINATRHARALVGGVIAGIVGRTDLFVSGGAEHQGPDGGGPISIIARKRSSVANESPSS
ncbi:MAG: ring-opening amidohydrolase [Aliidongia sp.]